ncbi:MAG TPA: putative lipid II flippase FtsW [Vicinamibacterales bacterium]|jgi:cell division protein FtsW
MARTLKSDKLLFWATLLLVGISVVMVYSASAVLALDKHQLSGYVLLRQLTWAVLGVVLLLVVMRVDYHRYQRPALIWIVMTVSVLLLLAVFFFPERNGTKRWIVFQAISIQPSELAKLIAIVFAAALLERRMHRVNEIAHTLLPVGLITFGLAALILAEPDFGTAAVLVMVVTSIIFAAGLSYRYLIGTLLVLTPVAVVAMLAAPYRRRRLFAFLDPWSDPLGVNFQLIQSLIAVGSGGAFGTGLMAGIQKLYYLPEAHTDFIFAVAGEELGLFGTGLILVCFAIMGWRGLRAALLAPDRFGSLLALGLTMMVLLQALVNMSVVLGLLPTKGIPLPFVSNGGSSLVINLVAMGILLNISQQSSPTAAATAAA